MVEKHPVLPLPTTAIGRSFLRIKLLVKQRLHWEVPFSGTIGVLISLIKHKHLYLSEADIILWHMVKLGYHSPVISLQQILQ